MQDSREKRKRKSDIEKSYLNTTIPSDLIRSLKILAANREKRINDVLSEAIQDLLKKYEKSKNRKINNNYTE